MEGADSAGVARILQFEKMKKVFKNGDFVIGCTSSFRMIQLLRFSFKPRKVYDKDIYEYMCTDFPINGVENVLKKVDIYRNIKMAMKRVVFFSCYQDVI